MLKLKLQYFGHLMQRADSLGKKNPDSGEDSGHDKWVTEDEMGGWPHRLNEREFEQAPGTGVGQRSLVCSVHRVTELDMT